MRATMARAGLILFVILCSPIASLAADPATGDKVWEWVVRLLAWAAGGWHYY